MDINLLSEQFFSFVAQVPGLDEFINGHKDLKDFDTILNNFREKQEAMGTMNYELDLMLKILSEKYMEIKQVQDGLHIVNRHVSIDDTELLSQFVKDTKGLYSDQWKFKKADVQHYKTITEKIAYKEVDFSSIIDDYIDCNHPYICAKIAIAYLEGKNYSIGLVFLQKALNHVFSYPNVYWNNPLAIYGCVDALHEFQYLLGPRGMDSLSPVIKAGRYTILRCLYLYLSRAIHMCDEELNTQAYEEDAVPYSAIAKMNYYSIRADLVYDYRQDFSLIFGLGVNPDIQYISDKAWAYTVADHYGLGRIAWDAYNDALKMYRHGDIRPNNSGGYAEIEDATFGELIERGRIRSEILSQDLFEQYKQSEFFVSIPDIADCIAYLRERLISKASVTTFDLFLENRSETIKKAIEVFKREQTKDSAYDKLLLAFSRKKEEWEKIRDYLIAKGIKCFYHFTDRRNLESIIKSKGLFSWKYCKDNNIHSYFGGNDLSRNLDLKYGLEDYVRVSFCNDHPMVYRLKTQNHFDLVLLKIKLDVAWSFDTLFSDCNATSNSHHLGLAFNDLQRIDFEAVKKHYLRRDDEDFGKHQAELLIKTHIPLSFIENINNPISL